jgi:hypothetical protein
MSATNLHRLPTVEVEQVPETVDPEQQAHKVQAASEGVVLADRVPCLGGEYRIRERIGMMPWLMFAHAAKGGLDGNDMDGLAAIYALLKSCIHPDDWPRFEADMIDKQAEDDDLIPVITHTMQIVAARPTKRRSDSPDGPSTTTPPSTAVSSPPTGPPGADQLVPVAHLSQQALRG